MSIPTMREVQDGHYDDRPDTEVELPDDWDDDYDDGYDYETWGW